MDSKYDKITKSPAVRAEPASEEDIVESRESQYESKVSNSFSNNDDIDGVPLQSASFMHLAWDVLLVLCALCFLTYALLVLRNDGKRVDEEPVPSLQSASRYGPTILPIVFAAIMASFQKTMAAWKLERGISIISLEYLLSSRSVFSTIAAPVQLRKLSFLPPILILVWMLSPFGGQAALRLVEIIPSPASESWPFNYLEVLSNITHSGPSSSAGMDIMPAILGAFQGALSSPANLKSLTEDIFGNVKLPMLEALPSYTEASPTNEWYDVTNSTGTEYSALLGIPVSQTQGDANYTFNLETSYVYANCSVMKGSQMDRGSWHNYMMVEGRLMFHNGLTFGITPLTPIVSTFSNESFVMVFTSYTDIAVTNATCELKTTYIEVEVDCHQSKCAVQRMRPSQELHYPEYLTFLNGIGRYGERNMSNVLVYYNFLQSFVNSTSNIWNLGTDPYSTPIEYYFTHPDKPFAAFAGADRWRGEDIYPIGDVLFSRRMSQLLNTFWIATIAPYVITQALPLEGSSESISSMLPTYRSSTGMRIPDFLILQCNRIWFAILVIASLVLLVAGVSGAVLGMLRKGPDILDHACSLLRDNPYAYDAQPESSANDAIDHTRSCGRSKIRLGDVHPDREQGRIVIGTVGNVTILDKSRKERLYR